MGYEGDTGYEGFEHQYLKSASEHRQNLFAKPANLHNQGHLHNPITYVSTNFIPYIKHTIFTTDIKTKYSLSVTLRELSETLS